MSTLTLYSRNNPRKPLEIIGNHDEIRARLAQVGVTFERWAAHHILTEHDDQDIILAAYQDSINTLKEAGGYTTADVISLHPAHPHKNALRNQFLSEHTHTEDEVRFFVKGQGLVFLHINAMIYAVLCKKGDLISVPGGTTHWFDMGSEPEFTCIRLFTNPEGWVAQLTGSDIATQVPNMDSHLYGQRQGAQHD